eukprot:tig00000157_g9678.t1
MLRSAEMQQKLEAVALASFLYSATLLFELAVSPPYTLELPRPPAPALVPVARTGEARPRAPPPAPAPLRPHARRRPSRGSSCGARRGRGRGGAGPPPLSIQYVVRREGRVLFQNRETVAVTRCWICCWICGAGAARRAKPKRPSGAAAARAGQQRAEAARYVLQRLGPGAGAGAGAGPGPVRGRGGPRVGDGGAVSPEFRAALAAKCRAILGLGGAGGKEAAVDGAARIAEVEHGWRFARVQVRGRVEEKARRLAEGRGAGRGAGGGRGAQAGAGGAGPGGGRGEKCTPGGGLLGELWRSFLCLGEPPQAPARPRRPRPRLELAPWRAAR